MEKPITFAMYQEEYMMPLKEQGQKEHSLPETSEPSMTVNPCYFSIPQDRCGETKFCGLCGKWLCDRHRKNYPKRMMAMIKEKMDI